METQTPEKPAPERVHWNALWSEVVTGGLCTGCAGCVVVCPHEVLSYNDKGGTYKPFHIEDSDLTGACGHGEKGCTACTRACPRFRTWEVEIDTKLFGRSREDKEVSGIYKDVLLTRAIAPDVAERGQDGGLVSAILIYALEKGYIDGALVSNLEGDGSTWKAQPAVATNKEQVLAAAGSRYTYSANTMALLEAEKMGLEKLALVGMGCMSSSPAVMATRKVGKKVKKFALNIGLLCSKTFDDSIFEELFEAKYGLKKQDMVKMNIKGVFQIWMKDGSYHEINLKETHAWTREGCKSCPDFAAEHADISTGGIGSFNNWTLTIVRTDLGRKIIIEMLEAGLIEGRPGDDDPAAIDLLRKLSIVSRRRWPQEVNFTSPRRGIPPPKPKVEVAPSPEGYLGPSLQL